MMSEHDPLLQTMVTYRQEALLAEAQRYRQHPAPSPLRVAAGLMLIRLGERLRGYTPNAQDSLGARTSTPHLRATHS